MTTDSHASPAIFVLGPAADDAMLERIGDARAAADRLAASVVALVVGQDDRGLDRLIPHGADRVTHVRCPAPGDLTRVAATLRLLADHRPRLILAPGDVDGRQWAARLAAARLTSASSVESSSPKSAGSFLLVSPALSIEVADDHIDIICLDQTGRLSRPVRVDANQTAVLTLRPGVAEALPPDNTRRGQIERFDFTPLPEPVTVERDLPADPATVDIRDAQRIIAGGRGLGSKAGFDALRQFAEKLHASLAASRMAVDLGWIDRERQVGQTGKTVRPDLYIACGISGASHHLEGMSDARHIVAVNTDPRAPIFKVAHLGLVVDLYELLDQTRKILET